MGSTRDIHGGRQNQLRRGSRLEIIGEAARHIPPEIRQQFPKVPWKSMAGMRDKLIHDYVSIPTITEESSC